MARFIWGFSHVFHSLCTRRICGEMNVCWKNSAFLESKSTYFIWDSDQEGSPVHCMFLLINDQIPNDLKHLGIYILVDWAHSITNTIEEMAD